MGVNITEKDNNVVLVDNNKSITVTDNVTKNTVNITQPNTKTVQISAAGPQGQKGDSAISGSVVASGSFSGSFQGDGTNLTGITAEWDGTHVGDAKITGSLYISGSTPTKIQLGNPPIWSVNNPTGTMYLTGSFYLSGSMITVGAGFSGSFSGSFQGDGSNLTKVFEGTAVSSSISTRLTTDESKIISLTSVTSSYLTNSDTASLGATIVFGDLTVHGTGSFDVFQTNYISSSIIYSSGSTKFGDTLDDTHQFTGSVFITGSSTIVDGTYTGDGSGLTNIPASGITGLNLSRIASGSVTASIAPNTGLIVNTHITASGDISSSANVYGVTGSFGYVKGSVVSGSHIGYGGDLTGIVSGFWTGSSGTITREGDVQITGSLIISGSFHSFTLDSDNIVLGSGAGIVMEAAANNNVILGTDAGASLTAGVQNVIIGDQAGYSGGEDTANILIGYQAGYNFGSGAKSQYNICIGNQVASLGGGGNGKYNIFMGRQSGNTLTSGNYNVGLGQQALVAIVGGGQNIALGYLAGASINSGNSNINIGYWAGRSQTTGGGNITLGSGSLGIAAESNQLRIGNGNDLVTISASLETGHVLLNSLAISSSTSTMPLSVQGSGSTVFNVIGSEGTLFSVDDDINGIVFTANDISGLPVLQASASGELYLGKSPQSLYTTAVISATSASSTASLCTLSTSSYDGAFFDYTMTSGSNAKAGNIMSVWSGGTINYTEVSTTDIGTTSGINFEVIISASTAQLVTITDSTNPNTWKVKTIIRSI